MTLVGLFSGTAPAATSAPAAATGGSGFVAALQDATALFSGTATPAAPVMDESAAAVVARLLGQPTPAAASPADVSVPQPEAPKLEAPTLDAPKSGDPKSDDVEATVPDPAVPPTPALQTPIPLPVAIVPPTTGAGSPVPRPVATDSDASTPDASDPGILTTGTVSSGVLAAVVPTLTKTGKDAPAAMPGTAPDSSPALSAAVQVPAAAPSTTAVAPIAAPAIPLASVVATAASTAQPKTKPIVAVTAPLTADAQTPPVSTPTIPQVTASAAVAAPQAATPPPLASQLSRPLFALATAGTGEYIVTVTVAPDNLGPVTVRAHVGVDGMRVELFAPNDLGREAIRAILPELRRDLAGQGLSAGLDLSSQNQPGDAREGALRREQPIAAAAETPVPRADVSGENAGPRHPIGSSTLDIVV